MSEHPFRFTCQAYRASSGDEWRELARRVEGSGYDALHIADHVIGPGPALEGANHRVQDFAVIPAMVVAAEVTERLRIGSRMICVGYHQPVVLAKQLASIDEFSGGRLDIGLGAGWLAAEYEAMGLPFPPAGERIAMLEEVVDLLEHWFSGDPIHIDGDHVRATGFSAAPPPVQRPHPPLMIGGGAPKILALAARRADIVSINFNNRAGAIGADSIATSTAEKTREKIDWVREAAGDRFDALQLEIAAYFVSIEGGAGPDPEALAARLGVEGAQLEEFPHALLGSTQQIVETLQRRREELGISIITIGSDVAEEFAPVIAKLSGR
jgi:probable F420-dependent oxidoreductase